MIQSVIFLIEKWRCSERRVQSFAKHIKRNQKLWSQGKLSGFVLWELVNWVSEFRLLNLFGRQTWRKIRCFPSQNDAKRLPNTLTINKANSFDPKGTQLTKPIQVLGSCDLRSCGGQACSASKFNVPSWWVQDLKSQEQEVFKCMELCFFVVSFLHCWRIPFGFWHLDTPVALLHRMPVL